MDTSFFSSNPLLDLTSFLVEASSVPEISILPLVDLITCSIIDLVIIVSSQISATNVLVQIYAQLRRNQAWHKIHQQMRNFQPSLSSLVITFKNLTANPPPVAVQPAATDFALTPGLAT